MNSSLQMNINHYSNSGLKQSGEEDELCNQLWLACAGPLVSVPQIGDKVFYFPQGHLEQIEAYMKNEGHTIDMPVYNVPSKILCKVVNVDLKAETNTDEVYAQITLLSEIEGKKIPTVKPLHPPLKRKPKIYWKKLTTSDTSTHGGLSIPKRCAEEIFSDIDMTKDVPSEDLVAKDLQGCKWHFRHIYRGQPKRHLITTGWSLFVTSKMLTAGDTAVFLRGENKELYIGIHRLKKKEYMSPVLSSLSMQHGILSTAFHATSTGSLFSVYYRPWTDPSQFIVPYEQYLKSVEIDYSIGTRFRMQFESSECLEYKEYKFLGTIIGSEDIDSIRWPNSEWRQLMVNWDNSSDLRICPCRVSPWSIEVIGAIKKKIIGKRGRWNDHSGPGLGFEVIKKKRCGEFGIVRDDGGLQGQEMRGVDLGSTVGRVMLFGVNLVGPQVVSSCEASSSTLTLFNDFMSAASSTFANRTCTKVLKAGTALGRSIDLTDFEDYKELIYKLDQMFEFNGGLVSGTSNWHITYINHKHHSMLLGNCPWPEFKATVNKIFICPIGYAYA